MPVIVHISKLIPLLLFLLDIPKSIIFINLSTGSYIMFSNFMSLWTIFYLCRYCKASSSCCIITLSPSSSLMIALESAGHSMNSITSHPKCFFRSRKRASYLITLGWSRLFWTRKFYFKPKMCSSSKVNDFAANIFSVFLFLHL